MINLDTHNWCRNFSVGALFFILSSCSFNNMYLAPDTISHDVKKARLIDRQTGDTLTVSIGENFQPTFTNAAGNTVMMDYKIESVLFDNTDGNKLNGWIITPNDNYNGITALFLHGNAGNITSHYAGALPFIRKGYAVFIIDYSGFGFSDGKATRDNVLLDATAALKYIHARSDLGTKKLIIYGQSLGGHLATVVAAQNEAMIDGLVVEGAFSSHRDIAAEMAGIFGRIFVAEKYCGYKSLAEFNKPVLIIHSTEDAVVPFEHGEKLFQYANQPKTFYKIDKCHICGPLYYSDSIAVKIERMLNPG